MCVSPPFQQILIDGAGHLLGRLASIVAKSTLQGMCVSWEVACSLEKHFLDSKNFICLRDRGIGNPLG